MWELMLSEKEEIAIVQIKCSYEIPTDSLIVVIIIIIIIVITRTETVTEDDEQYDHQNENSCRQSNAHDEGYV